MLVETTHAAIDLDSSPASAGAARKFIAETLSLWDLKDELDVVTFLANELVTNAILHARGHVSVGLRRNRNRLRCEVCDSSPEAPSVRAYALDDLTGRGLALIVAMAAAWGVEKSGPGKCVWFEVDT